MTAELALGLGAAALWLVILGWSRWRPERRLWPPRRGNFATALWAWGLTILIYAGLLGVATETWNALGVAGWLRWGIGGAVSLAGSILHSWATLALGLKATSGWDVGVTAHGPYARLRHPQYFGQAAMMLGIALIAGSIPALILAAAGAVALAAAARVEEAFLAMRHPRYAAYADRVPRGV